MLQSRRQKKNNLKHKKNYSISAEGESNGKAKPKNKLIQKAKPKKEE
jgi:hypothetical protein